jgi:5-methylcytosine-specific restriction protein A
MKNRAKKKPIDEEENGSDNTEETADKKGKGKSKGKSKSKKSAPPQSSLKATEGISIDSTDPLMTESYVGSSGVMHENGIAKVCEKSDEEILSIQYVPIESILVPKRIRVVIPDQKLKNSIAVNGVLEPIIVAPLKDDFEKFALVDGAKRLNACKELGMEVIPCVYGHIWKCKDLGYLEAITNMQTGWGGAEHLAFANKCLDGGIRNEAMVESLCDMDEGDAHKAIDIVTDNDPAIVGATAGGKLYKTEVGLGYKKLEARRKKEYEESLAAGEGEVDEEGEIEGEGAFSGEITPFTAEIDQEEFGTVKDALGELNAEFEKGKSIEGFEAHKQKVGERECLDPSIRKAAMERSGGRCLCCRRGGESYVDCLDAHHIVPVYLGGEDSVDNTAILCITCHRMVHLYGTGDLHLDATLQKKFSELTEAEKLDYPNEQIFLDERVKMRNIAKLGNLIREGAKAQKIKRDELKQAHPVGNLGRRMPGKNGVQTEA